MSIKKTLFIIAFFAFNSSFAQKWTPTTGTAKFYIKMLGVGVDGSFKGIKANIDFNPENPTTSSIFAKSINLKIPEFVPVGAPFLFTAIKENGHYNMRTR